MYFFKILEAETEDSLMFKIKKTQIKREKKHKKSI